MAMRWVTELSNVQMLQVEEEEKRRQEAKKAVSAISRPKKVAKELPETNRVSI